MKLNKKNLIAFIISLIFVILVIHNINLKELVHTFKIFNYKILLLTIPIYISTLFLRGLRWKFLLSDKNKYTIGELCGIYTTGSMMNIFFPARAGDFFRAYYLGKEHNSDKVKIFGSIALERIFDGIGVLAILFTATMCYHSSPLIKELNIIAAILFIGSLILLYAVLKLNKVDYVFGLLKKISNLFPETISIVLNKIIDKLNKIANSFISGFESLNSFSNTVYALLLSLAMWAIEAFVVYLLISNFGYKIDISAGMFVISFIALATIIPSSSIYVGPYQYAYILALSIYNIPKSPALAIAFVQQTVTMVVVAIFSLVYILRNNINYKAIKKENSETH